jgi:hypothetical protein
MLSQLKQEKYYQAGMNNNKNNIMKINKNIFIIFCSVLFFWSCNNIDKTNTEQATNNDSLSTTNKSDVSPLPAEAYKSKSYDEIGFELMEKENFGELK